MKTAIRVGLVLSWLIVGRPAAGESAQRVDEAIAAVRTGELIRVVRFDGSSVRGRFVGASNDVVEVAAPDGAQMVPERDIREIRRLEATSPRGAALGAGLGVAVALLVVNRSCERSSERGDCLNAATLVITPIGAAGGAFTGWLVGRARPRKAPSLGSRPAPQVIVVPVLRRGGRQLAVALTF